MPLSDLANVYSDPNYKIVGFINCEVDKTASVKFNTIKEYGPKEIREVIKKENLSKKIVEEKNVFFQII